MEKQEKSTNFAKSARLVDQGLTALKIYYDTIGQDYTTDRHYKHSQPRMAFGRALTRHLGDSLTSEVLEKDRTTIIHYKRNHESNLQGWDGYATFYETAEYIVDSYFHGDAKLQRIEYIDKMVNTLIQERFKIQSSINV